MWTENLRKLFLLLCLMHWTTVCQQAANTPIQWPVRRGTNWLMCSALRRTMLLQSNFNSLGWSTCLAKCGTDDAQWDWIAGVDHQWNVSIKHPHVYSLYQGEFLKITDIAETNNGTLYKCTVTYFNDLSKKSLDHETDLICLLFKQEEDIPTSKPSPTTSESVKGIQTTEQDINIENATDSLKTEGSRSCILWKALFGVFVGLFGVVLLFANRNKVWGLMKICHHSTSQTGDISSELSTSHNNKGQTGDINITGESQGTNGLDLVREDTPQAL